MQVEQLTHRKPDRPATEFQALAEGMQTAFLANLLGVSKQMVCYYRRKGAPKRRMDQLRAYLRQVAQ